MTSAEHYTYRVRWSPDDDEYVATSAEFPSLSWLAATPEEALHGMIGLAAEVVAEMETSGEMPPEPLSSRSYSGRFVVRLPADIHRDLVLAAAEQGVSLNSLALSRLVAA